MSYEKRLTRKGLLTTPVVFLLSLTTLLTVQYFLNKQDPYATIINMSGGQQVFFQKSFLLLQRYQNLSASPLNPESYAMYLEKPLLVESQLRQSIATIRKP